MLAHPDIPYMASINRHQELLEEKRCPAQPAERTFKARWNRPYWIPRLRVSELQPSYR